MTEKQIRNLQTAGMITYVKYFDEWEKDDRKSVIFQIYRDFPEYKTGTPEAKTSGAMQLYNSCKTAKDHIDVLKFIINSRADYSVKSLAKALLNRFK